MPDLSSDILAALRNVLPARDFLALHEPQFSGNERAYVTECLDSGWVSSVGKFVDRFESELAEYTGAKRAIAIVNGTAALHVCLLLAGVEPGDEVLIPALTFVATANAVSYCGAIPHLCESEEKTLGIDAAQLESYLQENTKVRLDSGVLSCINKQSGRRIRALIPMHTFGLPSDLDTLEKICARFGLILIEDAAESLGSFYRGAHTGNRGLLSALSFNGNKILTTGGGGAILTGDEELGRRAKHLTTTAKVPHRWEFRHDEIGFNYRMPNINAALGCAQLEQLPRYLQSKRALAESYIDAFADISGVKFVREPENTRSNYWLNAILLDKENANQRDTILAATNDAGIMTRPAWTLMSELPMYGNCPHMDLSCAQSLEQRLINIPSSAWLGEELKSTPENGRTFGSAQ